MADKLFIRLKNISVQFYYLAQLTDTLRPDIKSCLLFYFTDQALIRTFSRLKLSTDTDPLIMILIILFFSSDEASDIFHLFLYNIKL